VNVADKTDLIVQLVNGKKHLLLLKQVLSLNDLFLDLVGEQNGLIGAFSFVFGNNMLR
jgi:hypothetical protein